MKQHWYENSNDPSARILKFCFASTENPGEKQHHIYIEPAHSTLTECSRIFGVKSDGSGGFYIDPKNEDITKCAREMLERLQRSEIIDQDEYSLIADVLELNAT